MTKIVFNVFTANFDYINVDTSAVDGPGSSTDKAIARWNGTSGKLLQDSPGTLVQDSGAIEAQSFVFDRQIINDVTVPDHYSSINSDVELISGDFILLGDSQLILL
jgi:hypothetical protein